MEWKRIVNFYFATKGDTTYSVYQQGMWHIEYEKYGESKKVSRTFVTREEAQDFVEYFL